jgi:hypothetical protein
VSCSGNLNSRSLNASCARPELELEWELAPLLLLRMLFLLLLLAVALTLVRLNRSSSANRSLVAARAARPWEQQQPPRSLLELVRPLVQALVRAPRQAQEQLHPTLPPLRLPPRLCSECWLRVSAAVSPLELGLRALTTRARALALVLVMPLLSGPSSQAWGLMAVPMLLSGTTASMMRTWKTAPQPATESGTRWACGDGAGSGIGIGMTQTETMTWTFLRWRA